MTKLNPKFFADEELETYQDPRDRRAHAAPRLKSHLRGGQGAALSHKKQQLINVNELIERGAAAEVAPPDTVDPTLQTPIHERDWITT